MKRILIDIGHPAHVHYYKHTANELIARGHKIVWAVKEIEIAKRLLDHYGFTYTVLPKKSDKILGKIMKQLVYDIKLFRICKKEKIDIAIGTSASAVHVSRISSVKSIVFDDDDDDVQPLFTKFILPYADTLLSPLSLKGKRRRLDTIYYAGYHELAYLHPQRFFPDPNVLKEVGLMNGERYFIMRFNVFKAHHDVGIVGLSLAQKLQLIELLEPYGKIFITSEREIEPELRKFQFKASPDKIHSLMAFASIFLGDSQTMTSEAAVLGIPSIRCNSFVGRISYLEEEEKRYQLTFGFKPDQFGNMLIKLRELLNMPELKDVFEKRHQEMLADQIDVTAFWTWFIDQYPDSIRIMKENPDHHYNFR